MSKQSQLSKAAVVLKNLPATQSQKIWNRLESGDLRTVFQAINELDLDTIRPFFAAMDELARETQKQINTDEPIRSVETPLAGKPRHLAEAADNPFGFLFSRSIADVAELMADEHPREIAVVLTQLPKGTAAKLLQQLEPIHRVAVVRRLCDPDAVNEQERNSLSIALKQRLAKMDRRKQADSGQLDSVNGILDHLGSEETIRLAEQIGYDAPMLDDWVQQNSHCFSQFKDCSVEQIRQLFDQTDPAIWSSAMRECDPGVRRHILKSLEPSDSRLVGRQMLDITRQVTPPANVCQQQLSDALEAMKKS